MSFFGTGGSSSTNNNKDGTSSSSSGSGSGATAGWGSFLKQGLSQIESKLDMVLDMQVPIPGTGGTSTLTTFSGHSIVLPAATTTGGGGGGDSKNVITNAPSQSTTPIMLPSTTVVTRDSTDKPRSSSSSSRRVGNDSQQQQQQQTTTTRQETTIDPVTGFMTTTTVVVPSGTDTSSTSSSSGLKHSSSSTSLSSGAATSITRSLSNLGSAAAGSAAASAATAAAIASRERLEQRMRGIFKKVSDTSSSSGGGGGGLSPPVSVASSPISRPPSRPLSRADLAQSIGVAAVKDQVVDEKEIEKESEVVATTTTPTTPTAATMAMKKADDSIKANDDSESVTGVMNGGGSSASVSNGIDTEVREEKVGVEKKKVDAVSEDQEEKKAVEEQVADESESNVGKVSGSVATEKENVKVQRAKDENDVVDVKAVEETEEKKHEEAVEEQEDLIVESETTGGEDEKESQISIEIEPIDSENSVKDTEVGTLAEEEAKVDLDKEDKDSTGDFGIADDGDDDNDDDDDDDDTNVGESLKEESSNVDTESVEKPDSQIEQEPLDTVLAAPTAITSISTKLATSGTSSSAPTTAVASSFTDTANDTRSNANEQKEKAANFLSSVVEQREQQLFKVMQEHSQLIERHRDLEESRLAEQEVTKIKMAGLEKMIENQKRELESVRKQEMGQQPRSAQKALEEQRALLEEKDEQIRGLLEEGEALSKKEFQHLTIIKSLRQKSNEFDKVQAELKKKLDKTTTDLSEVNVRSVKLNEDLKHANEANRSLQDINTRHLKQMTRLESEILQLRDDKVQQQLGLDRAWQELSESRKASAEQASQTATAALEKEMKINEELLDQLEEFKKQGIKKEEKFQQEIQDLRVSLSNREEMMGELQDRMIQEIQVLQDRLQQSEHDSFEMDQLMEEAKRPLRRQLESLQNQQSVQNRQWERIEKDLSTRVQDSEKEVEKSRQKVQAIKQQLEELKTENVTLTTRIDTLRLADGQLRTKVGMCERQVIEKEEAMKSALQELAKEKVSREKAVEEAKEDEMRRIQILHRQEVEKLKEQVQQLQQSTTTSAAAAVVMTAGQQDLKVVVDPYQRRPSSSMSIRSSIDSFQDSSSSLAMFSPDSGTNNNHGLFANPTSGGLSRTGSVSNLGPLPTGTGVSAHASPMVAIERLSTMVRQLEGQVSFLNDQVISSQKQKEELSNELVSMTIEMEELQKVSTRVPGMEHELELLRSRHAAALEMLGEKTEEVNELRADIVDVKQAYRDQINELLSQLEKSKR